MKSYNPIEKRCEHRVPLSIPATFFRADGEEPLKGQIENISSWGIRARIAGPVARNTSLRLSFKVPETDRQIESEGKIRWCKGDGSFSLGIALQDKVAFDLPVNVVAGLCSEHTTSACLDYSDNRLDILQNSVKKLQYLTYWGALFELSSVQICTLFSQLAGQIGLGSFRFEKIYKQMEEFSTDQEVKRSMKKSIASLEQISGRFNEIASVFGQLKKKRHLELTKTGHPVDLKRLISNEVDFFRDVITRLTNTECNITCSLGETLPPLYVEHSVFALVVDFLLLYSWHSILLGNSTQIDIHGAVRNQTVHIDFRNDGSRIFKQDSIVIDGMKDDFADQLTPREASNIFTLYYSLIPLRKHNAYIVVHSESGNNIISLRIPT